MDRSCSNLSEFPVLRSRSVALEWEIAQQQPGLNQTLAVAVVGVAVYTYHGGARRMLSLRAPAVVVASPRRGRPAQSRATGIHCAGRPE